PLTKILYHSEKLHHRPLPRLPPIPHWVLICNNLILLNLGIRSLVGTIAKVRKSLANYRGIWEIGHRGLNFSLILHMSVTKMALSKPNSSSNRHYFRASSSDRHCFRLTHLGLGDELHLR
ncbi:hypothetical protein TorRG33x02_156090, partial [Trema orientale]